MVLAKLDCKSGSGKDSQDDSVFGITETSGDPSGGLYGAGRFGYSINDKVYWRQMQLVTAVAANVFQTGSSSSS